MAVDEDHYIHLLSAHLSPPPASDVRVAASLIPMGFPIVKSSERMTLCACHSSPITQGYTCPRCSQKICELPSQCPVCGLHLLSSPHLARSYHHLFPVPPFTRLPPPSSLPLPLCVGCSVTLDQSTIPFQCPLCQCVYCLDCDTFIHESLHNCPSCEMSRPLSS